MQTTLTTEKHDEQEIGGGGFPRDPHQYGGGGGGGDGGRDPLPEYTPPPEGYRIAIYLTLVSVSMLFLALASAYVFGHANIHPLETPGALWISTVIILLSSLTLEVARRSLRRRREKEFKTWISTTLFLGICFLVSQLFAWQQLVASGYYVNKNIHSGYAYIFTGLHGVHLLGGLIALAYLMMRSPESWTVVRRRVSVDVTSLYWHFIDGLWLFLLALVFLWK
jgi:cytochrome c oxidase subunit III